MSDKEIRAQLAKLNVGEFIDGQRVRGRLALEDPFKQKWSDQYELAADILGDERHHEKVKNIAKMVQAATYPVWFEYKNKRNIHYTYANVPLLDWYLGRPRETFFNIKRKTLIGIYHLIQDLIKFESDSLTGIERSGKKTIVQNLLAKRLLVLREAVSTFDELWAFICPGQPLEKHNTHHYGSFEEYADEASKLSGLVDFSCFPQTEFHDEVLFIRSLNVSELGFHGIRMSVIEAVEDLKQGRIKAANHVLFHALHFAKMLHVMLKVLRTMPPEHFTEFRYATEGASAIQSRGFHLMEIHFRGLNEVKMKTLKKFPYLADLEKFKHPLFVFLGSAIKKLDEAKHPEIFTTVRLLDKQLLTWRALHLSFAKVYSPEGTPGTGGTLGAPYLSHFLKSGIFDTTTVDMDLIAERFADFPEVDAMFKSVSLDWNISPPQDRIN
jgi:tryptophan 2,3-dioxygenase